MDASAKFTKVATTFNNSFDLTIPSLEFLAYHEYSDQLLELERAFLLPPSSSSKFSSSGIAALNQGYIYTRLTILACICIIDTE